MNDGAYVWNGRVIKGSDGDLHCMALICKNALESEATNAIRKFENLNAKD